MNLKIYVEKGDILDGVTLLDILFRGIPEAMLFISLIYLISDKKFDKKLFVLSSLIYILVISITRILPVKYGIRNIIEIISIILIVCYINKIAIIKAISSTLIAIIALTISEVISIFLLEDVFKISLKNVFEDPQKKMIYGFPSFVIFACFILIVYKFKKWRVSERNVFS